MTDKIIEAARSAGFRTGNITLSGEGVAPIPFIVPVSATNCQHELSRFYAIARAEALEDAANILQANAQLCSTGAWSQVLLSSNAAAIRALKEQQHG